MLFFQNFAAMTSSFVWIVLGGVFLTGGDILFRIFQSSQWKFGFVVAFCVYGIGSLCMMLSFFGENIAVASILTLVFNVLIYLAAAYFFFGDTVSHREIFGILLGLAAVMVIESGK